MTYIAGGTRREQRECGRERKGEEAQVVLSIRAKSATRISAIYGSGIGTRPWLCPDNDVIFSTEFQI
jgi:hypothetical protein